MGSNQNTMSYFKEIDAWLEGLLAPLPEAEREDAKQGIKERILESYRNGMAAGKAGASGEPQEVACTEGPAGPDFSAMRETLNELGHAFDELEKGLRARAAAGRPADKHSDHRKEPAATAPRDAHRQKLWKRR